MWFEDGNAAEGFVPGDSSYGAFVFGGRRLENALFHLF